eukprot:TRINITY_DN75355_c0_g1_i1.p1 TRINITY_DN75355_c0_g1~~TRINITY_DN75355_c0_g1_i1.p1  ORF type:complete len:574 (-),score=93.42 TRINITY_DN75355_c0_g1_i1:175-1896(-)
MTRRSHAVAFAAAGLSTTAVTAQHYCIEPFCKAEHPVVGKYTMAATEPDVCYEWLFKYLNNVVPGSDNRGSGYWRTKSIQGKDIVEAYDTSKTDVLAMESNECGLTMGKPPTNPTTAAEEELVKAGQRLQTGTFHQCPCALEGRAHIINATGSKAEGQSGQQEGIVASSEEDEPIPPMSMAEAMWYKRGGVNGIFGLHAVKCAFHSSGPCLLKEIEEGVSRAWQGNFSKGYVPLMDNNLMLWTPTLGPLLDMFLRDGVQFYPMRWQAPTEDDGTREVFSVMVSPCGKVLYEIAAPDAGGRAREEFHQMETARAIFKDWNQPGDRPLMPLRVSKVVTPELMDKMLAFYGVSDAKRAEGLGFHTTVLQDDTSKDGRRVVTLKLSDLATVHMQIWSVPEPKMPQPWSPNPEGGFAQDFKDAVHSNQVTGKTLERAREFCTSGEWSVARYNWYVLQTHEASLAPVPANSSTMTPPAGNIMNSFMDDHISWDCTADSCEISAGIRSLYTAGSRVTFYKFEDKYWWPYSHDPAGYGIELHWSHVKADFQPQGEVPPICFEAKADGTCPGAQPSVREVVI